LVSLLPFHAKILLEEMNMPKITSSTFRIGGVIAFTDNTNSSFNIQANDSINWTYDAAKSNDSHRQIANNNSKYYTAYIAALNSLKLFFAKFDYQTAGPAIQKTIRDMTLRVEVLFTTDDQLTHSAAAVYEDGQVKTVAFSDPMPSNASTLFSAWQTAMGLVTDQVQISLTAV
jgi:hypothetical protein